jgi:hypothetical protein
MAGGDHPKIASLRVVVDGIALLPGAFNRRSAIGCAALASPRMQSLIRGRDAGHNLTLEDVAALLSRRQSCERIAKALVR